MSTAASIDRNWILAEFSKGIGSEQTLVDESKARRESPPDPELGALYHEIEQADERHCATIETIATRYGHTPARSVAGGIGETLGRLKGRVSEFGSTPWQLLGHDLSARADVIHWCTAWVHAFQAVGDDQSSSELAVVLSEEKTHRDALQEALNRLVARGALGEALVTDPQSKSS